MLSAVFLWFRARGREKKEWKGTIGTGRKDARGAGVINGRHGGLTAKTEFPEYSHPEAWALSRSVPVKLLVPRVCARVRHCAAGRNWLASAAARRSWLHVFVTGALCGYRYVGVQWWRIQVYEYKYTNTRTYLCCGCTRRARDGSRQIRERSRGRDESKAEEAAAIAEAEPKPEADAETEEERRRSRAKPAVPCNEREMREAELAGKRAPL